jgi:Arc/MetJ-type ribon-helix-helix transcriptional regulator
MRVTVRLNDPCIKVIEKMRARGRMDVSDAVRFCIVFTGLMLDATASEETWKAIGEALSKAKPSDKSLNIHGENKR